MERVSSEFQLSAYLGTEVHENVNWKRERNSKISSCYGTLSVLKKLKHLAPYNARKHLAECLILSKIDYNDIVSDTIADYLVKRLQRVQLAAAKLSTCSSRCNLTLNPKRTKVRCFFQLPRCHEFMDQTDTPSISVQMGRVSSEFQRSGQRLLVLFQDATQLSLIHFIKCVHTLLQFPRKPYNETHRLSN